jgi:hypothetical protein
LPAQDFDGGYRGKLRLLPALPVASLRKHLEFVAESLLGYERFFEALSQNDKRSSQVRFRWRNLDLRFFRSLKKRTPAAFAHDWCIAYNVNGSLNYSRAIVSELLFHEIFHLNDFEHDYWSERALQDIYLSIKKRCRGQRQCLQAYCRGMVTVKGGSYYAFHADNDVREYAAELATIFLREQSAALAGKAPKKPFKCLKPENAKAWRLLKDEFFGAHDLLPACLP